MGYKKGQKVVCINTGPIETENGYKNEVNLVKLNHIYTIEKDEGRMGINLKEIPNYYLKERFITIINYRKIKIERLKNNRSMLEKNNT